MTTEQTQEEKPKLTQKDYNQKWLNKLPEEQRKKYFKLKAREKRNWKCKDCGQEPIIKTLETKVKLCIPCLVKRLKTNPENP